eukprot:gnl/TRDRNA2_/TRDRNA2_74298_c0_seq2.p1 gnl/TRDRNA2_/TRDRNA2_74298_c0~~gnl/TRDRNA2_/TRDRNA2_74298_c0_seq2.p1  ORF type:complete len:486 (+),score=67.67 gnl/TRDRNA2_/TRDRNA2_74298_c0_seq2:3-1460(+)
MFIALFGWMGMVFFSFTSAQGYFPSFISSMRQLYTLLSTNNMPDIMTCYEPGRPFVVIFLIAGLYLGLNVLVANVYEGYKSQLELSIVTFFTNRQKSVDVVFEILLEEEGCRDGISAATLRRFFHDYLNDEEMATRVFSLLDQDHDGFIKREEFRAIADAISDASILFGSFKGQPAFQRFSDLSESLDDLADVLSVIAAGIVLWQTDGFAEAESLETAVQTTCYRQTDVAQRLAHWTLFFISFVYLAQVRLEILVKGMKRFLTSQPFQNRFDLLGVSILIPLEIIVFMGGCSIPEASCRWLMIFRGLRVLRCLHKFPPIRDLILQMYHSLVAFSRVCLLIFLSFYIFAMTGTLLLGGKVAKSNPILAASDYGSGDLWPLNFNDFHSALSLLWNHLVSHGSVEWVDAFSDAFGVWAWFFFFAFDLCNTFVLVNVLTALVIDWTMIPLPPKGEEVDREMQLKKMFCLLKAEDALSERLRQGLRAMTV